MRSVIKSIIVITIFALAFSLLVLLKKFNMLPEMVYYAEDFHIQIIKSNKDMDKDGLEDYADILEGAKIEAKNRPMYKSAYYDGGYSPDNEGVCTDVIWRSLKNAGYNLKDLVDKDIQENIAIYTDIDKPDQNIDFRRVRNLKVFFD